MAIIPLSNYLKNLPQNKTSPKVFDLGLPKKEPAKIIDLGSFLSKTRTTTPATIEKSGGGLEGFLKGVGQSIARSFIAAGTELQQQLLVRKAERKPFGEATYTPQGEIEKKIFGTDKPISFKTVGEETLAIGGEDFKSKWGMYALPVGMIVAGLDITPIGFGKGKAINQAAKIISKTDDVTKIAKVLKTVVKGSDETIEFLAKSLKAVNKTDDVVKIIGQAGKAKTAAKIAPKAQKAIKEAIPPPKGIIPQELQPLAQEARKYKSAEEFIQKSGVYLEYQGAPQWGRPFKLKVSFIPEQVGEIKTIKRVEGILQEKYGIKSLTDFYTQAVKGVKEVKPKISIGEINYISKSDFPLWEIDNAKSYAGSANVKALKEKIKSGVELDPIRVFRDATNKTKWNIYDGSNRFQAYNELGIKKIPIIEVNERGIPIAQAVKGVKEVKPEVKIIKKIVGKAVPPKTVIRKVTEIAPPPKMEISEREVLRLVLKGQEKAARVAFREGQKQGIFDTKEKFETFIEKAETKQKMGEIGAKINKIETKNLPLEYKQQIKNILKDFDLKFRTGKTLAKREAIKNYVERLRAEGQPVEIPDNLLQLAESTPLNNMTPEQLEMLYEEVKRLVHLGRLKNTLIKVQANRRIDSVAKEITDHLEKIKKPKERTIITKETVKEGFFQRQMEKYKGFVDRVSRVERILLKLDSYNEGGLMQRIFYEPINKATNQKMRDLIKNEDAFRTLLKENKINLGKVLTQKQTFSEGKVILTGSEKIGVYLHSLNSDNLMHIKYGNKFTDSLIEEITGKLTPEEKKIANYLQDYFQKEGLAISKIRTLIEGKSLGIVENYFPIKLEWKAEPVINFEQDLTKEESLRFVAKWASSRISKGFLKERSHRAMQPVDLDALLIYLDHTEKVAHYEAFAPVIRDLQMILKRPGVRAAIEAAEGREGYKVMDQWLKQTAETNPLRPLSSGDAAIRSLRVNSTTAVLGMNLTTAIKQTVSFFNGMAEIGELPTIKGFFSYLSHPREVHQQIKDLAPQIYKRSVEREVAEAKIIKGAEKRLRGKLSAKEVFMIMTTTLDRVTVNIIWKGAFDTYLKRNPGMMEEAAGYATKAIRKTQPYFDIKDLPEYYRSGEFMKTLTIFTNQLNQNFNYYRYDIWGKMVKGKISYGEALRRTIEAFIIPALLIGMISRSRPAKDAKEFLKDIVSQVLAIIPILGSWLSSGYKGFRSGSLVTTETLEQMQNVGYHIAKDQWDKIIFSDFPTLVGYIMGLPVVQPKRIFETILDMSQGNTDDWLRFIWGKYQREEQEPKKEKPRPGGESLDRILKDLGLPPLESIELEPLPELPKL